MPAVVGLYATAPALLGVEKAWAVLGNVPDLDTLTTVVGVGSLVLLLVWAFGPDDDGLEIVGHIDSGLPAFGLPDVSRGDFLDLLAVSVGVMLVGFAEGLGAAKTYAAEAGYDVDANRELLGLGGADLGAGLDGGMVVNGSLSKTAVNGGARARRSPA